MLALFKKSVVNFFEFPSKQSATMKKALRNNCELSKARTKDESSSTPLVWDIMLVVTIYAPSVPILNQFPSGSMDVNLTCQLPHRTLKISYIIKVTAGSCILKYLQSSNY